MVTKTKRRKSRGSKKCFIGKPTDQIQEQVQAVGPERAGRSLSLFGVNAFRITRYAAL